MVTKKDIMVRFNLESSQVEQIQSKQLFKVYVPAKTTIESGYIKPKTLLLSYYTVIGYFKDKWYLTRYKYSPTTSKQLTQFANKTSFQVEWVDKQITLMVE